MLGDRWSLLIVRDMMLKGVRSFAELLAGHEGIATNILADRMGRLMRDGIVAAKPDPSDGRRLIYRLTAKGMALAPVLAEMVLWAAAHEKTGRRDLVRQMRDDRERFIADLKRKWRKAR